MKFCSAYYSDIGKKETNQDSLLLMQRRQPQGDEIVFAVICDGVGGLKMGEQASAEVVTAFHDWFNNQIEGLYQQEIPMTALFNDWDKLIQELHGLLKEHSENVGFRSGTTVEAVLLMKNQYYVCHIGDCRTYVLSDTIDQLTTDHTVVQREITEGRLSTHILAVSMMDIELRHTVIVEVELMCLLQGVTTKVRNSLMLRYIAQFLEAMGICTVPPWPALMLQVLLL